MRLFTAIPFSEAVCAALLEAQAQLRWQGAQANFTRPENLHLTLAFLGETPRQRDAVRVMDAAVCPSFAMTVEGGGRFGQLYWAGVTADALLEKLASRLQNSLRAAGFAVEKRPFRPHITLARQLTAPGPVRVSVVRTEMTAERMLLLRSDRINGRLVYTPVHETRLIQP